ncbi:MAG: FHA domain-containing protein, partial [Deltaproteobacteria bacterium]|nr:FHA domain-containing protein [Deltaproteobacteria bacterium]
MAATLPTGAVPWDAPDLLSAQRGQLVVVRGEQQVQTLDLEQRATFVGRDPQSTLVLDHPSVSSEHFRIQREGDGWLLLDLGSESGTYVDGARVSRVWLKPGSEIQAGEVHMR